MDRCLSYCLFFSLDYCVVCPSLIWFTDCGCPFGTFTLFSYLINHVSVEALITEWLTTLGTNCPLDCIFCRYKSVIKLYHQIHLSLSECRVKTYNYVVLGWHWRSLFSRLLRICHMQSLNKTIKSSENGDFVAEINHFCTLKQYKYLFNRHEHVFHCTRAFLIYVYYAQLSVGIKDRMV